LHAASTSTWGRLITEIARLEGAAAEHVGQDSDALAAVDPFHGIDDVLAALLDVRRRGRW